jgi:hypothetical protein
VAGTRRRPSAQRAQAFEIALTTQDLAPLEVVAAGTYPLVVPDPAQIHKFRLTGEGVDVATEVAGTGEERFEGTFTAGEVQLHLRPAPQHERQPARGVTREHEGPLRRNG